ncbi:2-succinyl-5-enolpyruvyl-6-hydroxy-3-cyclohexene-1-carboxylic-acid synthase [Halohasta salina]|uniref:2-succinyl-5-enolpyruvyl-6-hydroxy-3- cyclohexene-1-carboxylic-acid synthase n=1 Tax=Halohasta salina TaxID=2961621 RepID=UPI0020A48364|nr:2-succinyl-5-enolpyruvyl-6-hydroxy-3-cyclohexene-1-carboxylic-acid synthase [Halohasta salina]
MTAPNRNTLWGRAIAAELARNGVRTVCLSPGSRSTPLTVACDEHDDLRTVSALDERSAAYFALGRARRTGEVTPLISTSGTAAANYHPAVIEASQGRVPLLLLTADRPPELRDSGANQTVDQEKLYGDAVRWYKDLPEPVADERTLRSLRTDLSRAVGTAEGTHSGPVHLNVPFKKPLEPTPVDGDVPADLSRLAAMGRGDDEPFVRRTVGQPQLDDGDLRKLAEELSVDRGLIVAGPADPPGLTADAVTAFSHATGFPILADPLSGLRFGGHTRAAPVIGGYDGYVNTAVTESWPDPEVVVRLGASPTSKPLRKYLAGTDARQLVVDPAGAWREAEFTATDLVVADPDRLCGHLSQIVRSGGSADWRNRWTRADAEHGEVLADHADEPFEGGILADVVDGLPDPSTLVVSNSMPVRDLDRFGMPSTKSVTAIGNRGASGIDGIVSTALGAAHGTTDDVTLVIGDLAYYHDMNGLLALARADVEATIVLVNNDGGGIFHMLPIEDFEPPFTSQFKTPHGIDFEPTGELYGFDYRRVDDREAFRETYAEAVAAAGSQVIEVRTDAAASHDLRDDLQRETVDRLVD